jgi:hypothetical protein
MSNIEYKINIISDLGVHALILFTFLTSFFLMYVSKLSVEELKGQLNNIIENDLGQMIRENKEKYKELLSQPLNMIPYNKLKTYYSKEDPFQKMNNSWLKESLLITNFGLFIIVIGSIFLISNICTLKIDIMDLIKINVLTFLGIGIVEYLFFTRVALNYVPTPPSLLLDTIIRNTKNYFLQ